MNYIKIKSKKIINKNSINKNNEIETFFKS